MKHLNCLILVFTLILFSIGLKGETPKSTVIVLGSEPECIASAIMASNQGYNVIMLTKDSELGGLMTEGLLTIVDVNYDYNNHVLNTGFFSLLLAECGNGHNLDLELLKQFFNDQITSHHINVYYNASNFQPIVSSKSAKEILGVCFKHADQSHKIYGDFIIDGSEEASFSRRLGIPYLSGRSEFGFPKQYAAATLVFSVDSVDWDKVVKYLVEDELLYTHAKRNAAWGYPQMYNYVSSSSKLKMRGLNLSRQNDGSVVINALLVFNTPPDNKTLQQSNYNLAVKELPSILTYLRQNCAGFENAKLHQVAKSLYIREGIRIVGEETLHGCDVFEHTSFPTTIAYGSYPIDLQATSHSGYGNALSGISLYSVPLGTMLSPGYDNLLIIGRKSSFDIVAHGSARTLSVLIQMAENATLAMTYSQQHQLTIDTLLKDSNEWQSFMRYLHSRTDFCEYQLPSSPLKDKWYAPYVRALMNQGLFSIGYTNLPLDSPCTKETLSVISTLISQHSRYSLPPAYKEAIHTLDDSFDFAKIYSLLSLLSGHSITSLQDLYDQGFIDLTCYTELSKEKSPTLWSTYLLFGSVINHLLSPLPTNIEKAPLNVIYE